MSLDMYLYARRALSPGEASTDQVLAAAGVTLDDLKVLAGLDPRQHETSHYLSRWDWEPAEEIARSEAALAAAGLLDFATPHSKGSRIAYRGDAVEVDITSVYWCKANAVHGWFVENVQGGTDDCGEYPVAAEQLAYLASLCTRSAERVRVGDLAGASALMTPRSGFFFGGTDIDEWYVEGMTTTATELERVVRLAATLGGGITFHYVSSW